MTRFSVYYTLCRLSECKGEILQKNVCKVLRSIIFGEILDQPVQSVVANSALLRPNPTYAGSALGMIEAFVWIRTFQNIFQSLVNCHETPHSDGRTFSSKKVMSVPASE